MHAANFNDLRLRDQDVGPHSGGVEQPNGFAETDTTQECIPILTSTRAVSFSKHRLMPWYWQSLSEKEYST